MRAVIQRVSSASASVVETAGRRETGKIGAGFLILLGVGTEDTETEARWLADKLAGLRVFEDEAGRLNLSIRDVGGSALVVSNFTLYADCRKGRRPSFTEAASGPQAKALYERFQVLLAEQGVPVECGEFGARMEITLVNDGPITLVVDTPPRANLG